MCVEGQGKGVGRGSSAGCLVGGFFFFNILLVSYYGFNLQFSVNLNLDH